MSLETWLIRIRVFIVFSVVAGSAALLAINGLHSYTSDQKYCESAIGKPSSIGNTGYNYMLYWKEKDRCCTYEYRDGRIIKGC